jgi:hypothetical protein
MPEPIESLEQLRAPPGTLEKRVPFRFKRIEACPIAHECKLAGRRLTRSLTAFLCDADIAARFARTRLIICKKGGDGRGHSD